MDTFKDLGLFRDFEESDYKAQSLVDNTITIDDAVGGTGESGYNDDFDEISIVYDRAPSKIVRILIVPSTTYTTD